MGVVADGLDVAFDVEYFSSSEELELIRVVWNDDGERPLFLRPSGKDLHLGPAIEEGLGGLSNLPFSVG